MPQPDDEFVYRAIRGASWVNALNEVQINAFRRRPRTVPGKPWDEHGISVDLDMETAKTRTPKKYHGVLKIRKSDIYALGLGIEIGEDHANITNVPFDTPENELQVIEIASALAAKATKCVDR